MEALLDDGIGWPVGEPGQVVPIVPAAILFDLGRGGSWGHRPRAEDGRAAYADASASAVAQGCVGAGTGAKVGGFKGGIGSASVVLASGTTVAALVAVNAAGSAVDPATGLPYAVGLGLGDELAHVGRPSPTELDASRVRAETVPANAGRPGLATTIGVIATDATLTKAQCQKASGVGHDGLARALKPVHTLFDGDTLFTLATGERPAPDPVEQTLLMEAGADCVARAVVHALLAATSVDRSGEGGIRLRSWSDAFPSALRD
jgi:putative pantetheine hydrolase